MKFQAYCPHCEQTVSTHTMLAGSELKFALDSKKDIQVIHTSDAGDHQWNLIDGEKENLCRQLASGLLSADASLT
jgi:hypothetical protein